MRRPPGRSGGTPGRGRQARKATPRRVGPPGSRVSNVTGWPWRRPRLRRISPVSASGRALHWSKSLAEVSGRALHWSKQLAEVSGRALHLSKQLAEVSGRALHWSKQLAEVSGRALHWSKPLAETSGRALRQCNGLPDSAPVRFPANPASSTEDGTPMPPYPPGLPERVGSVGPLASVRGSRRRPSEQGGRRRCPPAEVRSRGLDARRPAPRRHPGRRWRRDVRCEARRRERSACRTPAPGGHRAARRRGPHARSLVESAYRGRRRSRGVREHDVAVRPAGHLAKF
ncbi:uncharacterized protein CMC5_033970 [Chondromyces crocatus]|uniref:Uncharacterized protein n=1 Tax=Chondromyces crocatus TaxID=52 RepID=A0A0K1EEG8_CHOCO|nr:uncharacterized protein CMC5_033970 [Chondromyces crocatus]